MQNAARIYRKISNSFRFLKQELKAALGMYNTACSKARGARIVVYHGVCTGHPTRFNTLFIRKENFEQHLELYRKYFHIISLQDYYNGHFRTDKFNICLTFDDGFANNHAYVLPLLKKYNLPATFFVTAIRQAGYDILWNDFLTLTAVTGPEQLVFENELFYKKKRSYYQSATTGKTLASVLQLSAFSAKQAMMKILRPYALFMKSDTLDEYWLQMTTEQIREMADSPLVTIGSHGYYHNDLSRISGSELEAELRLSKAFLEQVTGKRVTSLAFPYGHYSSSVIEEATRAGYHQLLATTFRDPGDENTPALLERMGVNPFISAHNQLYAIVKGHYEY
jgi:peptidoglycan/xylan/chitin deacetylase (PgdA/CDA1 family)